uniref:Uncharacterized protein n=1 Tax=Theileria annulata TaxID=5874 RepID=A0A3B0MTJ2_THEAN
MEEKVSYSTMSAVLETVVDDEKVRVALMPPHIARRLVKEPGASSGSGILSRVTGSILVDLPFRNLLYESKKVQRLYFELEPKDPDLYPKSKSVTNSLLLIDPIRLTHLLNNDLNQAQRVLYMRCFTDRIWLIFLRLVSLGVGSRLRSLYSLKDSRVPTDEFLSDLEELQLSLVQMVLEVTRWDLTENTASEIETAVLNGCKNVCFLAEHMRNQWNNSLGEFPLLNELVPYLNKCMLHINKLLLRTGVNPGNNLKRNDSSDLDVCLTDLGTCSPLKDYFKGEDQLNGEVDSTLLQLQNLSKLTLNLKDTSYVHILGDIRNCIVSVATKSATLLSLMKLKILDFRQRLFELPGSYSFINNEVLRKGFLSCGLDENDAVPLVLLSHCLGAYSIREWVIRFLLDVKFDKVSSFLSPNSQSSVNSYGFNESAYFRTAGQTKPNLGDFFTLMPLDLRLYMNQLVS